MPSTFSTNLRLELQASGENAGSWGAKTNTNLDLIEDAISGFVTVPITDGTSPLTLTTAPGGVDQSRNMMVDMTGTLTADATVVIPALAKTYIFKNSTVGGKSIIIKVGATANTLTLRSGLHRYIYTNGTLIWSSENWVQLSQSGNRWALDTYVDASGEMHVGKWINFHSSATDTNNWNVRLGTVDATTAPGVASTTNLYITPQGGASTTSKKIVHTGDYGHLPGGVAGIDADTLDGKHASQMSFAEPPTDGKLYARKCTDAVAVPPVFAWVEIVASPWTIVGTDAQLKIGATVVVEVTNTGLLKTKDDIEVFSTTVG